MEKTFIVHGKGLEEALDEAAIILQCPKERVAYEILQEPKSSCYGRPGVPCKLRVIPIIPSADQLGGTPRKRSLRHIVRLTEIDAVRQEFLPLEESGQAISPEDRARLWRAVVRKAPLNAYLRRTSQQKSTLLGMINEERDSRMCITDRIYPAVKVRIDDTGLEVQQVTQYATFSKDYETGELRTTLTIDTVMNVTVLFFAHYQDIVGIHEQRVAVPMGSTVGSLARQLQHDHAGLPDLLAYGRVAVNAEFATSETVILEADEIAWMPPMSGGHGGNGGYGGLGDA